MRTLKSLKVFTWISSSTISHVLPRPIRWKRCYLEATNLKSTASGANIVVEVAIEGVTSDWMVLGGGSGPEQLAASFFIAADDLNINESHMVENYDTERVLHRLDITVTGYQGAALATTPAFMILRFEELQ